MCRSHDALRAKLVEAMRRAQLAGSVYHLMRELVYIGLIPADPI